MFCSLLKLYPEVHAGQSWESGLVLGGAGTAPAIGFAQAALQDDRVLGGEGGSHGCRGLPPARDERFTSGACCCGREAVRTVCGTAVCRGAQEGSVGAAGGAGVRSCASPPKQQPLLHASLQGETEQRCRFSPPSSPLCINAVSRCVLSCSARAGNGISAIC